MSVLRSVAAPLALLLYAVLSSNCEPVDVALNKPIDARVTCGYSGPEQFLSHRYVYANSSLRLENTETCNDTTSYPPSAMVDGQDTWWQSASRSNIIIVLGPSVNFQAEISIDLQQVCIHFDASARIASVRLTCIRMSDQWFKYALWRFMLRQGVRRLHCTYRCCDNYQQYRLLPAIQVCYAEQALFVVASLRVSVGLFVCLSAQILKKLLIRK